MRRFSPLALLLVAASPPICPERPPNSGGSQSQAQARRTVVGFLDADGRYVGSGTLIDRSRRLILTATHVVRPPFSEPLPPQFTYLSDPYHKVHYGKLIWKTTLEQTDDEDSGKNWDLARDIAIIQDDEPVSDDALVADLAPSIARDERLKFSGFPEGGDFTQVTDGSINETVSDPGYQPTSPAANGALLSREARQCTRSVMRETRAGMSGSSVVTPTGRVTGVIIATAGPGQAGRYVRLSCFFNAMRSQADTPPWLMDAIQTMDTSDLIDLLQNSPNEGFRPISNLELDAAASSLQSTGHDARSLSPRTQTNIRCALIPVAYARNLPTEEWGFRWNREAADGLQQWIEKLKPDDKRARARQLVGMFLNALKPEFVNGSYTAANASTDFTAEDLRTLAGLSDAAFIASDDEPSSAFMRISEKAAAIIILSGRGSSALIGKAYARFGAIYGLEGDYAGSNRAYNEATLAGFVPAWVWRAKADASRMLKGSTAGGLLFPSRVRDAAAGSLSGIK